ncbi:MAG: MarR family transcriptional regulator [Anaerolineae bacterium]|jgi:DNA-binding MarR family transcriptional regulator
MNGSSAALSKQAIHRFLMLLRHLRQYSRQVGSQGVRPRQFSALLFLLESGPATVGQVQEYLYHSASTTSTVIAQLEEAGYVTRTRSEEDNRVVIVELTPEGQDVAQNTPLGGIPLLRRRLSALPQERLEVINQVLAEILQLVEVTDNA